MTYQDKTVKDVMTNLKDVFILNATDILDFKKITEISKIPFLDDIVVKFGISNVKEHYHVPLLLSPFGYSTYRGS